MKTPKHSLRKIVTFLNNEDEDGGFWLPNIQRNFVWKEEQICRLFDSILREYPISTLLVWKTRARIRHRKFIDNYRESASIADFYVPDNDKKKCLVLDGQQRLQALFIGLRGSYEGRELFLDILSGEVAAPDDVKFKFKFMHRDQASFPWIKFKDLVFGQSHVLVAADQIAHSAGRDLPTAERNKVNLHVSIVFKTFHSDDGVSYQELDSIECPELYTEEDVVEIFIRANSGGTRLGKSDLLFSLLSSTWDDANIEMEDLLDDLNRTGFKFSRDFVLKACLTILDKGARYEVSKFRDIAVREEIQTKWEQITGALKDVVDFVGGKTFIRSDKALSSYLVLIPLVYTRYHFKSKWASSTRMDEYLLKSLLCGAFSVHADELIDACVARIKESNGFDVDHIFDAMLLQGKTLNITPANLWQMHYGSDSIHLLFNLWYRNFNYTPAFENNFPQIDHIFPQSKLKAVKDVNPDTGLRNIIRYKKDVRDQLANCMLLTAAENGSGGKGDTSPLEWFKGKPPEYLEMHLIPTDPALWKLDAFDDFITERRNLIQQKFAYILAPVKESSVTA